MTCYYNENDPKVAAWLRELIRRNLLPAGDVDERSIADVQSDDVRGFTQAHFFAGIGGWPYALRLASWPDDRPVWTGSCPCQPFSVAGRGAGTDDPRHLWPEFARLISKCRPSTIFGEQVTSKAGRAWLTAVRVDLETMGYGVGAADLCAAGVGAPHIRQRLFWVADRESARLEECDRERGPKLSRPQRGGEACGMGNAEQPGLQGAAWRGQPRERGARGESAGGCWNDVQWLPCLDGEWRPTQPGISPLAHGVPARVVRLRGYGNSIVPQVAAEFVMAYMDTTE